MMNIINNKITNKLMPNKAKHKCTKCNCYTRYKEGMCQNCSIIANIIKATEASAKQMSRTIKITWEVIKENPKRK